MPATSLNHVSVCATNLDESVRFYQELFGMVKIPTPNFGFPVQWLRVGSLQLHIFQRPDEAPTYHHVALTVDDFEEVYRKTEALGIHDRTTFGHHLFELPGSNVQLYLRDPAGNLIEVDWPDVRALAPEIIADMQKLADKNPQTAENMSATLFV
jgi:catechol 2,3-dioxygenase-like lactoylglutathione lyase family enzyme